MSKNKHKRSGKSRAKRIAAKQRAMQNKGSKAATGNTVWHLSSEEATLAHKPHYNGYACGHGTHGDTRYNRTREKRAWKKQLRQEGASRGSFFLFSVCLISAES